MNYLEENSRTGRILLPDLVRAFALLGIVLVNVAFMAFPVETTYHAGGLNSRWDHAAYFSVNSLFLLKSYTLFSFMFGVGLAHQMISAERHGRSFGPAYFRRMLGLIVLGVLHVTLAFHGDILIFYGFLGAGLFLFRKVGNKALVITGIVLVFAQVLVELVFTTLLFMGEAYAPDEMNLLASQIQQSTEVAIAINAHGDFFEVAMRRWFDWSQMLIYVLPFQGPGVFGFFLFGLAAARSNALSDASTPLWAKSRRIYLPVGVLLSLVGAIILMRSHNPVSSAASLGLIMISLGAPFSSLGYIGLLAKWSERPVTALKVFVARGGSASLTAYLLQSIILSLIFSGYGLGLYARPGAFLCITIALLVGIFTLIFSSIWRSRFSHGPMELLLRRWTYLTGRV